MNQGNIPEDLQDLADQIDSEPDESSDIQSRLEEAEREREQSKAMALRYAADLENYKRRAAADLTDMRERANTRLLLKLVDAADDFDRALSYVPEDAADAGWLDGLTLVRRNIGNLLDTEGVSKIEADTGMAFDPTEHEAVFSQPTSEIEEGAVFGIVRNGYKLHGKVLRAAQVIVARAPEQNSPT